MADWTQIPYDLISMIANRIPAIEDFLALSAVCRSWRSVYVHKSWSPAPVFPWLMLSESRDNQSTRAFFSFHKNRRYLLPLPEAHGRRCWGSSCGWIVTIGLDLQIHLLNPITRNRIDLPPQSTFSRQPIIGNPHWFRTHFIHKAFVFNRQFRTEDDLLVMAIHGQNNHLAFSRPGYNSWVTVETSFPCLFKDVTVFDGKIFAVCNSGNLVLVENVDVDDNGSPTARQIASPPNFADGQEKLYLVESSGELLMLCRRRTRSIVDFSLETISFDAYRFDFDDEVWVGLGGLGDRALFIGDNNSLSISSVDDANCDANCIYFTDDDSERWPVDEDDHGKSDIGMYNMADRSIRFLDFGEDFAIHYSCPVWVSPAVT
ncbi:hypothetical protein U1Q18_007789 [Sarracenia purpurea var. burkii]